MTITPDVSNSPQVCARCYEDGSISVGGAIIEPNEPHYRVQTQDKDERICSECMARLREEMSR